MLLLFITITTLNDLLLVVEVKTRKTTVTNTVMKGNELWFSLIFFRQRPKRLQWFHLKRREIHLWMRSKIVIQGSDFLNHSTHSQHSTTNKNHIYSHYFDHMDREKLCGSRKYPDPHHGGNWKFQGGGGVRGPGNSKREGGWTIKSLSRGAISFRFRPEFEHCFLPTW